MPRLQLSSKIIGLAARRRSGTHLAGYWEFLGGKSGESETHEHCLAHELKEEFNINTRIGSFWGKAFVIMVPRLFV